MAPAWMAVRRETLGCCGFAIGEEIGTKSVSGSQVIDAWIILKLRTKLDTDPGFSARDAHSEHREESALSSQLRSFATLRMTFTQGPHDDQLLP